MYLVHLTFLHPHRERFPDYVREMVECAAESGDGLEHVSVHRRVDTDPTIGLFLRSRSLADAEHTAARIWHRTTGTHPELDEYQLFRCEVPLIDGILP